MYTWAYLKAAAFAKLDLTEDEATAQNLTGRFYIYANEVITQVCSSIKPKYTFAEFVITPDKVGVLQTMPDDFVAFGDDVNTRTYVDKNIYNTETDTFGVTLQEEATDYDFTYKGYNQLVFYKEGTYSISYYARWYTFASNLRDDTQIPVPNDILDCIPSYIAHQCYKIDDEVKASIFRNEYEMFLARIDNTHYKENKTIVIGGGW